MSAAEQADIDTNADETQKYQTIEAQASRDQAVNDAQALCTLKSGGSPTAYYTAVATDQTAYTNTVGPAAQQYSLNTSIADQTLTITQTNADLAYTVATNNTDRDLTNTDGKRQHDFDIGER